jgi:alkylated DNA repair dioxygenase AlkB
MINMLPKDGEVLYQPSFFSQEESNQLMTQLINETKWQQDTIKFYGKEINLPRLTSWYGDTDKPYTYSGIMMNPHEWSPLLLKVKQMVEETCQSKFSSVLLNYYRDGKDSVSWHQDDEPELGTNPTIASISLGATRTFKFRHITDKTTEKVELTNGSLVIMKGETQHMWQHSVPKTSKEIGPRINLTFRLIV